MAAVRAISETAVVARVAYVSRTTGGHDIRWVETLRTAGHDVTVMPGLRDPRRLTQMPCDLVVAGPITDAVPVAVSAGVAPVLALSWAFDVFLELPESRARETIEAALRNATGVHVDCESVRDRIVKLGVNPNCISVAPWGIDADYFSPGAPRRLVSDPPIVLSVRAWEPLYQIGLVLDAFEVVHAATPDVRLVLAGSGSCEKSIRNRIAGSQIQDSVTLLPRLNQRELRFWLRRADVYVAAAECDGTSLSLLEALACGVPCVVPDVGGNPEWVSSRTQGALYTPGNAHHFAHAIECQLQHGALVQREERRRSILTRVDWAKNREVFLLAVSNAVASVPGSSR